ncbi:DUF2791 family P-loop domain-containing protein [Herbiconiux sp. CPCC 205763]|uniref:DUF2791 family P-loop domain-containing protein n=1 Tax=Herbiconiux aconitum TaxID=2970913 RepID=A0ABT2GVQ1_9MICO|nr:LuxR family transcriptional regulator [Herbiconiux aconitum]MCS5720292.1 DUF2791 family P-loop domain-containing protein [Herbiconiux aconitum]
MARLPGSGSWTSPTDDARAVGRGLAERARNPQEWVGSVPQPGSPSRLIGRQPECERLSGLLTAAREGRGGVLIVRGEAGVGKSALLQFLLEQATDCQVARVVGVESEAELAYAGLHQLCAPFLSRFDALPAPQNHALRTVFGLQSGAAPDRFLVGLAVLTLLSELAESRPLICCVDDAQWLDDASAQALEFAVRRLGMEPVVAIVSTRDTSTARRFDGLAELVVTGLSAAESIALLDSAVIGTIEPAVRDRIVAESHGNPLALLELPRGLSAGELSFESEGGLKATPMADRLEQQFLRRTRALPRATRRLLLLAAAEPVGDRILLERAAARFGIEPDAATPAETAGLIELDGTVRFRHPLVRSAIYRSATPAQRRQAHQALADSMDAEADPDRTAWHRARAVVGPDDAVADELERSATRATAQGGLAAAAAFLERAAALTGDPSERVRRNLDAAQAKTRAGGFADSSNLLRLVDVPSLADADRARIELVRAENSFGAHNGNEALPLLLSAARRLEPIDARLARDAYVDAFSAAVLTERLAAGPGTREVAEAVRHAPPADPPRLRDALLEALAIRFTEGFAPALPLSRRAVEAFAAAAHEPDGLLSDTRLAAATAASLWDDRDWDVLTRRQVMVARAAEVLDALPRALVDRTIMHLFTGDLAAAAYLVEESRFVADLTGSGLAPYGEIGLLAVRGDLERGEAMFDDALERVRARGEGAGVTLIHWARAVLYNGLGRYEDALDAARIAAECPLELGAAQWALAELVEAAARIGDLPVAEAALDDLSAMAAQSGTEWALGVAASRRALVSEGESADELHRLGLEHLARTTVRVELARARLLYGEWLRRERRRAEARGQLRAAHSALAAMGLVAFAERARRELLATGETVRTRDERISTGLTPQEATVAKLAVEGLTNPEIGTALYISPRTVEWHLHHIFTKLGVTTRRELRRTFKGHDV